MHVCPGCKKMIDDKGCWCPKCHANVVADIERRKSLPCGKMSCRSKRIVEKKTIVRPPDKMSIKEAKAIYDDFCRRNVRVRGGTYYMLDENPWSAIALRCWEDADRID